MTYPILNATSMENVHPALHNAYVDVVAHCGAVGNGVTDDLAAFDAAVSELDDGSAIIGTILIPTGNYKLSGPWVIGDGTKYVSIKIQAATPYFAGSSGVLSTVMLSPSSVNDNGIVIEAPQSKSHSVEIDGVSVKYASVGTGIGLDLTQGYQMTGPRFSNMVIQNAGTGIKVGGSVNARFDNVATVGCTKGWHFSKTAPDNETANVPILSNCYAQANGTGLYVDQPVNGGRFDSIVVQSNTGPGIEIASGGYMRDCTFTSPWFEFPGSDMIRVSGGGAGFALSSCTFITPRFDGSTGVGGRHVINITAASASAVHGENLTFITPTFVNLNGGYFLYTATDPTNTNDPGFFYIHVVNAENSANMKGIHTSTSAGAAAYCTFSGDITDANVIASSVYGTKPRYHRFAGDAALAHYGSTLGFYGVAPATRPTAYTQTYSTADKTHANPTAAALTVTDGAGTNDNTIGAITAAASVIAAVQELADEINKLVTDLADVKQVVNSVIDDLQTLGLLQ